MEKWFVPAQMYSLRGSTVTNYGYDQQGNTSYTFNRLGFRSLEPTALPRLVVVGNSIAFGIGVELKDTFGFKLAQAMHLDLDNRAFGCYFHENHDHLSNIQLLSQQPQDSVFLIQINNLDRRRVGKEVFINNDSSWCIKRFLEFFEQTEELLKNRRHKYIYWDEINYKLPQSILKKIIINNKFHLDRSPLGRDTFGIKSHGAIAKLLYHVI